MRHQCRDADHGRSRSVHSQIAIFAPRYARQVSESDAELLFQYKSTGPATCVARSDARCAET
jgi:hypothetical protein